MMMKKKRRRGGYIAETGFGMLGMEKIKENLRWKRRSSGS